MDFQGLEEFEANGSNDASVALESNSINAGVSFDNQQDQRRHQIMNSIQVETSSSEKKSGGDNGDDHDQSQTKKLASNSSHAVEPSQAESETAAEERIIADQRQHITDDATAKLHSALQRIKDVTKSMLNEMEVYLESAESVEVDYVRCQYSQRMEGRRLKDVEPDITGTTATLNFQLN